MGRETERKFLVKRQFFHPISQGVRYLQGYLSTVPERVVRVRVVGDRGYLTIKGLTVAASRLEYEYTIPAGEAEEMLKLLCLRPILEKIRYREEADGRIWEVDEFLGENQGLIVAEIELRDASQAITLPAWIGTEVTGDPRYFNSALVEKPFKSWNEPGGKIC